MMAVQVFDPVFLMKGKIILRYRCDGRYKDTFTYNAEKFRFTYNCRKKKKKIVIKHPCKMTQIKTE